MEVPNTKSIRYDNFETNLKHGLCSTFTQQEFCDMTVAVGNHLYNAHKIVLSISSMYLRNILLASPTKYPIVVLSDVRPKILEYLLQFMYCGTVEVPANDIDDFLSSGRNLHIKGLQAMKLDYLRLSNKEKRNITNQDEIDEIPPSSTLTFCPDSIRPHKPTSNFKRKLTGNLLGTTKKSKKKHSVSFKIEPDYIKDNDEEIFQYENIMEPEVRIQDDFVKGDQANEDGCAKAIEGPQVSNHAGKIESADIKFVKGTSGKLHLLCNNYTFHKNTMRKDRVYWLCAAYQSQLQCRARCVTINGNVVSITGYHNHETDYKERLSISSDNNISLDGISMVDNLSSMISENSVCVTAAEKSALVNDIKEFDQSTSENNEHTTNPSPGTSNSIDYRQIDNVNDSVNDSKKKVNNEAVEVPLITNSLPLANDSINSSAMDESAELIRCDVPLIDNDVAHIETSQIHDRFSLDNSTCEDMLSLGNRPNDFDFPNIKND